MLQALDKISTKFLRLVPFVLGFLVPLFFLPTTVDYFALNKYYLIVVIGTLSLLAWCVRSLVRGKLSFTASPALLPLVILVIANIVSSVWLSSTPHNSLFGQTSLFFFMLIIFVTVTSSQKNHQTINLALYGLISSATILSIFTLLHYFDLVSKIIPATSLSSRYFNPTGSVLPALTFTLPILVATIVYTIGIKNRILQSLLFCSILLMIAGSVLNVSLVLPQNGTLGIYILPFSAGWSIAIDVLKSWKSALLGTGPETYFSAFTRLRPAYLNLDKNIWNIRFSESSNYIFTLLTTTGLIGTLAFLFSFLSPLVSVFKQKSHIEEKNSFNFIVSALIAVIISFFAVPVGVVSLALALVLLILLTIELKLNNSKFTKDISYSLAADTVSTSIYHDLPNSVTRSVSSSFLPWIVTFISVALLSGFWFFASQMYLGSVYYKNAAALTKAEPYQSFLMYQKAAQTDTYNTYYQQRMSQIYLAVSVAYLSKDNATADEKTNGTNFAQNALDAGKLAAKVDPLNVTAWENLFTIYKTLIPYAEGSSDLALSHGLQAISLDPTDSSLYLQLGTLIYNLGDADNSIKYIERASELKQDWNIPYINLSTIYKTNKDYSKALQYAQVGLQYTDLKSTDLSIIQEEIKALQKLAPAAATTPTATSSATTQ